MTNHLRLLTLSTVVTTIVASAVLVQPSASRAHPAGSDYLCRVMDEYHDTFGVYTDAYSAGNHFSYRGLMSSTDNRSALPPMNEACVVEPHSGITCIEANYFSRSSNWGGWYFMNGVLQGREVEPKSNWGDYPDAGFNLSGATGLTFWARGKVGNERVEFFALGIGRDPYTGVPLKPYPDSSSKISTGLITLSTNWREYTISLHGKDLSYVIGGFGWVASASQNENKDITFYIDDIQYNKSRLSEPRLLVSFETIRSACDFDTIMRNVAFTYDNALALLCFLSSGKNERARLIADALVYALLHDRFYNDGRLRNAYQGGDLILFPGWTPNGKAGTVRMPGWYDAKEERWLEDLFQVSSHTGNMAWVMIALLAYYEISGGSKYLSAAEQIGEWVERNCKDQRGAGGYTGGFEGWEPSPAKLTYKATEHNIDLFVAFMRLYLITRNAEWLDRANHAKQFFLHMWDEKEGKFWTGTEGDGVEINSNVVPMDIQGWAILALREESEQYWKALEYVESHHKVVGGFDFNQDRDGIWYEGTAQMAVAYHATGNMEKWQKVISDLNRAQFESGGLPAANKDGLTTGFDVPVRKRSGTLDWVPWLYYRRPHVGATAWLVLAEQGVNPFWVGSVAKLGNSRK